MTNENAIQFEELLKGSEELQEKLKAAADAFTGDKSDVKALFDATVGKLAEEAGLPFTYEDTQETAANEQELSDDELDAVAGGSGFCFIIGGSDDVEAGCGRAEGHACAYIGIGFIDCTR